MPARDWAAELVAVSKAIDSNGKDKHVAIGGARLLGGSFTTSTREVSDGMAGGTYTVTVYCAGKTRLTVAVKIGAGQDGNTVTCSEPPQPIVLRVTTDGGASEVQLTAVDGTVAPGYVVDRNGRCTWSGPRRLLLSVSTNFAQPRRNQTQSCS